MPCNKQTTWHAFYDKNYNGNIFINERDILIQQDLRFPFKQSKGVSVSLNLRCSSGVENKGVIVSSTEPIAVMGNNQASGWSQDVLLVNALRDISTEYLVVSPEPTLHEGMFTVISAYSGTTVAI